MSAARADPRAPGGGEARLRAWLEHVAQQAIDWLDALDAGSAELEDDERELYLDEDCA